MGIEKIPVFDENSSTSKICTFYFASFNRLQQFKNLEFLGSISAGVFHYFTPEAGIHFGFSHIFQLFVSLQIQIEARKKNTFPQQNLHILLKLCHTLLKKINKGKHIEMSSFHPECGTHPVKTVPLLDIR